MQSHGAGAALLRRLRLAWFLEVRPTDQPEVLLALAAELHGVDVGRLRGDFAREASVRALRLDMALARRPDRVALALGKTARPAGGPGPRFSTPTYVLLAGGRTATVPGFQPLEAYEVALHNLAPDLERRPAPDPSRSWSVAPANPTPPSRWRLRPAARRRRRSRRWTSLGSADASCGWTWAERAHCGAPARPPPSCPARRRLRPLSRWRATSPPELRRA